MDDREIGDMSPLALMLSLMHENWAAGHKEVAVGIAKLAAPYLHARAAATPPAERVPLSMLRYDQLGGWIDDADAPDGEA